MYKQFSKKKKVRKTGYVILGLFIILTAVFYQKFVEAKIEPGQELEIPQAEVSAKGDIPDLVEAKLKDISIKEKQIIEINKSLKNVIEENQRLMVKNRELEQRVNDLKSDQSLTKNRYNDLVKDRDGLLGNIEKVKAANRKYSRRIQTLEREVQGLDTLKNEYDKRVTRLEEELTVQQQKQEESDEVIQLASATSEEVQQREEKTLDLLTRIDAFTEEDEKLRMDSAKAHYNMGNIYFQRGEYEIAVREYYQAVTLMPDDPDSHYNLAYVSGEYLEDYRTALKHYKMYLYLNPEAKDRKSVQEKILHSELKLRSTVDSPLEDEER